MPHVAARQDRRDQLGVMDDFEHRLSKIIDDAGDPNPDGAALLR